MLPHKERGLRGRKGRMKNERGRSKKTENKDSGKKIIKGTRKQSRSEIKATMNSQKV